MPFSLYLLKFHLTAIQDVLDDDSKISELLIQNLINSVYGPQDSTIVLN